jgi:hypothetical protein
MHTWVRQHVVPRTSLAAADRTGDTEGADPPETHDGD